MAIDLEDAAEAEEMAFWAPLLPSLNYGFTTDSDPIEEVRPAFERSIDVEASGTRVSDMETEFTSSLPAVPFGAQNPLIFRTTPLIRARVYELLLDSPALQSKITLSPTFATNPVFPSTFFLLPGDVLNDVEGALSTCRQLRDELLTFFWTKYTFHVTLSPFTAPMTSPLSQKWLQSYANRVQSLVIEVDLTKFGFGYKGNAAGLGAMKTKIEHLFLVIIDLLSNRPGTMRSLHLMCRRYEGYRPIIDSSEITPGFPSRPDADPVLYCPIEAITICDHVDMLSGSLLKLRMSGFTQEYTDKIMARMFGNNGVLPQYNTPLDHAWPLQTPNPIAQGIINTPTPPGLLQTPSIVVHSPSFSEINKLHHIAYNEGGLEEDADIHHGGEASIAGLYSFLNFSTLSFNESLGGDVETENSSAKSPEDISLVSTLAINTETQEAAKSGKGKGKETDCFDHIPTTPSSSTDSGHDPANKVTPETVLDFTPDSDMTIEEMCRRMDHSDLDIDSLLILTGAIPSSRSRELLSSVEIVGGQPRPAGSIKRLSTFLTRVTSIRGKKSE